MSDHEIYDDEDDEVLYEPFDDDSDDDTQPPEEDDPEYDDAGGVVEDSGNIHDPGKIVLGGVIKSPLLQRPVVLGFSERMSEIKKARRLKPDALFAELSKMLDELSQVFQQIDAAGRSTSSNTEAVGEGVSVYSDDPDAQTLEEYAEKITGDLGTVIEEASLKYSQRVNLQGKLDSLVVQIAGSGFGGQPGSGIRFTPVTQDIGMGTDEPVFKNPGTTIDSILEEEDAVTLFEAILSKS